MIISQSGYPVGRQPEGFMIMRGVGLGQISLGLLQSLILPFLGKVVERGLCRNAVLKEGLGTRL